MALVYAPDQIEIRQVWADNLAEELKLISDIVDEYRYVAVDTEFPGTAEEANYAAKYTYEVVKNSVNATNLIQLGLTFSDYDGRLPTAGPNNKHCIWQFNFQFDVDKEASNPLSIDFLIRNGIDLKKHKTDGIDAFEFGEWFTSSGLVMKDSDVSWIAFHGAYDFAYLLKNLRGRELLPETRADFYDMIKVFFPVIYDTKYIISIDNKVKQGGLDAVAEELGVKRVGRRHQAGSDSLLTSGTFFKLRERHIQDAKDLEKHAGFIFGVKRSADDVA